MYIILIIIIFIIIILEFTLVRNLNKCNLKKIILHNEFCTYNNYVHKNMIKLIDFKNKKYNILEIGSGDGHSTINFLNYLNDNNVYYSYTYIEIDDSYNDILNDISNKYKNTKYINNSWENLNDKYDIIITTSFSSINNNNYEKFKTLCNKDTIIITIINNFKYHKINNFNMKIINYKNISLLLSIYRLKFV